MKRLLAALLALVMVLSLAACGEDPENTKKPDKEANSTTGTTGTTQDSTPREDVTIMTSVKQVAGDGTVKIDYQYSLMEDRLLSAMGIQEGSGEFDVTFDYDEAARTVTVTGVNPNNADANITAVIEWNAEGRIAVATETRWDGTHKTEYAYDEAGNCISEVIYKDGEHTATETFTYDADGRLLTQVYTLADGTIHTQKTYVYDEHGNEISYTVEYDDGDVSHYQYSYTYDENGNITCKQNYEDGRETSKIEYTYDENGNLVSQQKYNDDGIKGKKFEYSYDSNGRLVKTQEYNSWGEARNCHEYTYDAEGNLIQEIIRTETGELEETLTYTYKTMRMSDVEYMLFNALMAYAEIWY